MNHVRDMAMSVIWRVNKNYDAAILKTMPKILDTIDGAEDSLEDYDEFADIFRMLEEQRHHVRDIAKVVKDPSKVPRRSVLASEIPKEGISEAVDVTVSMKTGNNKVPTEDKVAEFDRHLHQLGSEDLEAQVNALEGIIKMRFYKPSNEKMTELMKILIKLLKSDEYEIHSKIAMLLNNYSIGSTVSSVIKSGVNEFQYLTTF